MAENEEFLKNDPKVTLSKLESFKLYRRRWFILFLYVMYATSSAMQWVEYCIITNIITKYYNVSARAVDWTSLITMVTYPPLLVPATYIIDKKGLRVSAIIGVVGTTVGTWIKVFSVRPNLFWVTFLGQTVVFVSQIFILSLPPKLAIVWFGENEVSRACGIGVFGQQLGTALGFVIPPWIIKNHDNIEEIGKEISILFYGVACFTTPIAIMVIIFFKSKPPSPPNAAQAKERNVSSEYTINNLWKSYISLLSNKPFLLQLLCYGINIGVFAAICTVLNQFVLSYFPNSAEDAGMIGLLMIVLGMIGSIIFGYVLDKSKKYKETTFMVYVLTLIGVVTFMLSLESHSKLLVYLSGSLMGFFMNSYYPIGIEFGAELTFPHPESTSSGILISGAQTFGIFFILVSGWMLETIGTFWALMLMSTLLFIGCILTAFVPNLLKRQAAFEQKNDLNNIHFIKVVTD